MKPPVGMACEHFAVAGCMWIPGADRFQGLSHSHWLKATPRGHRMLRKAWRLRGSRRKGVVSRDWRLWQACKR